MTERKKSERKNTNGIQNFLWAIESSLDAQHSRRIVSFGHGRNSTFKPDNRVEIDMNELRNGQDPTEGSDSIEP